MNCECTYSFGLPLEFMENTYDVRNTYAMEVQGNINTNYNKYLETRLYTQITYIIFLSSLSWEGKMRLEESL